VNLKANADARIESIIKLELGLDEPDTCVCSTTLFSVGGLVHNLHNLTSSTPGTRQNAAQRVGTYSAVHRDAEHNRIQHILKSSLAIAFEPGYSQACLNHLQNATIL
jgi:hypothetical protein